MSNIKLFQDKKIRSAWIVSPNLRQYWSKMKDRDLKQYELYPIRGTTHIGVNYERMLEIRNPKVE